MKSQSESERLDITESTTRSPTEILQLLVLEAWQNFLIAREDYQKKDGNHILALHERAVMQSRLEHLFWQLHPTILRNDPALLAEIKQKLLRGKNPNYAELMELFEKMSTFLDAIRLTRFDNRSRSDDSKIIASRPENEDEVNADVV